VNIRTARANADLERFRRQSQRNVSTSTGSNSPNAINAEERRELVRKNLFTKTISGEKSVADLARLLAISRGAEIGMADEEVGGCSSPSDVYNSTATMPDVSPIHPSVPPVHAIPEVQVKSEERRDRPITSPNPTEETPISLRNILNNLTQSARRLSHPATDDKQLECSICLENFNPNDAISWAKDGGDPTPTSNSAFADTGCDHIFHQGKICLMSIKCFVHMNIFLPFIVLSLGFTFFTECLISWLELHDDCPLCRRKVVHANAEVRFAGWEDL
jgi:predicted RNA-binding Zn ribbon-like protein